MGIAPTSRRSGPAPISATTDRRSWSRCMSLPPSATASGGPPARTRIPGDSGAALGYRRRARPARPSSGEPMIPRPDQPASRDHRRLPRRPAEPTAPRRLAPCARRARLAGARRGLRARWRRDRQRHEPAAGRRHATRADLDGRPPARPGARRRGRRPGRPVGRRRRARRRSDGGRSPRSSTATRPGSARPSPTARRSSTSSPRRPTRCGRGWRPSPASAPTTRRGSGPRSASATTTSSRSLSATDGLADVVERPDQGSLAAMDLTKSLAEHDTEAGAAAKLGRAFHYKQALATLDKADAALATIAPAARQAGEHDRRRRS